MEQDLNTIVAEAKQGVQALTSIPEWEAFKAKLLGTHGSLTQLAKGIAKLTTAERPVIGKLVNQAKNELESLLESSREKLESEALQKKLGPLIDFTLPPPDRFGTIHPLTQIRNKVITSLRKIGFSIAEGPELETEWFCFDALNTPDDHPARDVQDTLFLLPEAKVANTSKRENERFILRTHTSNVQIHTLLKDPPPLRIISPGKAFRRDNVDATHSANFHQIEGLCIDKDVSIKDFKAALDFLIHDLFGKDVQTRLRPSFFPFTEPSFEMDLFSPNLGKLSNRWVELMGCGMIHPQVLINVNLDPTVWSGYAFGLGIERLAMFLLGIDDIRYFYQNDLRFLTQFN